MAHEYTEDRSFIIASNELELGFSRESGMLTVLRRPAGTNFVCVGATALSVDVKTQDGWLSEHAFPRYLNHTSRDIQNGMDVVVNIGLGAIRITDTWHVTGTLVARSVEIHNSGTNEYEIHWVRLLLPAARVGGLYDGRFEAPSNSFRPRLAVEEVARHRRGNLPDFTLAPAVRRSRPFENAPDRGPGLLALHSTSEGENLLCWYWSREQSAFPDIDGHQSAITLGHDIEIAGWLPAGATIGGGTQYLMVVAGAWNDAIQAFHKTWNVIGVEAAANVPKWVRKAAIYETHAGLWGGFAGLTAALLQIRQLGCDTLNLMPIWQYDNHAKAVWDGDWVASGSPYAIEDFEQLEPTLGTPAEFRALVDRAHELGMKVLCDLVVQGCARTSRYVGEKPGWFCRTARGKLVSSHGWNDTYSFDWANPALQDFYVDWTTRFVQDYDIDGWRVDAPHRKEPNWDRRLDRIASSTSFGVLNIIERVRQRLREIKPDGALLCELYGPLFTTNHDFAYDYLAHLMFFHAGLARLSSYELSEWLEDHFLTLPYKAIRVCFIETHDTRDVNPVADAVRGSRLARMLLVGMVGCGFVPMIWSGQERGQEAWIQRLLTVRQHYPILIYGSLLFNIVPCDVPSVWTVVRAWHDDVVAVILNLGAHRRTATFTLPVDKLYLNSETYHVYDVLNERVLDFHGNATLRRDQLLNIHFVVEPYAAMIVQLRSGAAPTPSDQAMPEFEI